jgi:hypothetical protein
MALQQVQPLLQSCVSAGFDRPQGREQLDCLRGQDTGVGFKDSTQLDWPQPRLQQVQQHWLDPEEQEQKKRQQV